jgi:prepilin peptidase CpaA
MIWAAIAWFLACIILACLVVAIATDLARRIIPNSLVLIVLGCGLALRLACGPWPLFASFLSASAVFAGLGLLAAYDLLGWGDAKLITAVTFIVPVDRVAPLLLAIALAGGLLSCVYLAVRFALRRVAPIPRLPEVASSRTWDPWRLARREGARILTNEPMPYAVAIFGGVAFGLATR